MLDYSRLIADYRFSIPRPGVVLRWQKVQEDAWELALGVQPSPKPYIFPLPLYTTWYTASVSSTPLRVRSPSDKEAPGCITFPPPLWHAAHANGASFPGSVGTYYCVLCT